MPNVLIFPSSLDAAARYADEAKANGYTTVGASSVACDPFAARYDYRARLPYINDPQFFPELRSLVERFAIAAIFTPHAPTFLFLARHLPQQLPGIRLLGDSPYERQMRWVRQSLATTEAAASRVAAVADAAPKTAASWVAALCAQANQIYGECSAAKIVALCSIFVSAPPGDVVEIGSFFGGSTYVLNRLAARHRIGVTLAVDRWDLQTSVQRDSPPTVQALSHMWDWDLVFQGFLLTMQACSVPPFNYLRATSAEAAVQYRPGSVVATCEFGRTELAGSISVLHIDGNHDEAAVAQDFALWGAHLARGGWVIFDDYEWALGDGPRKVADAAIVTYGNRVRRHFVAGGALFLNID